MLIQLPKLLDNWLLSQDHLEEHVCQAPQLCVSIVQMRKTPTYEQNIFQTAKTMERQLLLNSLKHLYSPTCCLPIPTDTPTSHSFFAALLSISLVLVAVESHGPTFQGRRPGRVNTSHLHQKPLVKEIAELFVLKFVSSKM